MLRSRRVAARAKPGYSAVRKLYRSFFHESSPEGRGQMLLRHCLSPDERKLIGEKGYLDVTGCHTGKRYRIYYASLSNIRELDERGEPKAGLCLVPVESLPLGDVLLAQKIALETDERAVLAAANHFSSTSVPLLRAWRRC